MCAQSFFLGGTECAGERRKEILKERRRSAGKKRVPGNCPFTPYLPFQGLSKPISLTWCQLARCGSCLLAVQRHAATRHSSPVVSVPAVSLLLAPANQKSRMFVKFQVGQVRMFVDLGIFFFSIGLLFLQARLTTQTSCSILVSMATSPA